MNIPIDPLAPVLVALGVCIFLANVGDGLSKYLAAKARVMLVQNGIKDEED